MSAANNCSPQQTTSTWNHHNQLLLSPEKLQASFTTTGHISQSQTGQQGNSADMILPDSTTTEILSSPLHPQGSTSSSSPSYSDPIPPTAHTILQNDPDNSQKYGGGGGNAASYMHVMLPEKLATTGMLPACDVATLSSLLTLSPLKSEEEADIRGAAAGFMDPWFTSAAGITIVRDLNKATHTIDNILGSH
eukprot:TRINITY_DN2153_c0_g1_i3.p1 TRINITY_DN2153_c0_g1~~TRINITY_DN2153_c0_g1_i3.p1  ORF type:complete len:205 (+),score=55.61 TRINITY_DN2153_c0_g1_i3:42-617(+)